MLEAIKRLFKPTEKVYKWKGKGHPLYRKNNKIYWKGIPTDDDEFCMVMDIYPEEYKQYNYWIRRLNKRVKRI